MTVYEQNYNNRLNEMFTLITERYGAEDEKVIYFAQLVKKYTNQANYTNREKMEKIFKGLMK